MLSNEQIENHLRAVDGVNHVEITGDGYHYHLVIVSDVFIDKTKLARQKWVYTQLKDYITTGSLHALSMKTWTKNEWEKQVG